MRLVLAALIYLLLLSTVLLLSAGVTLALSDGFVNSAALYLAAYGLFFGILIYLTMRKSE